MRSSSGVWGFHGDGALEQRVKSLHAELPGASKIQLPRHAS